MVMLCCVPAAQYAVKATSVLVYPLGPVVLSSSNPLSFLIPSYRYLPLHLSHASLSALECNVYLVT